MRRILAFLFVLLCIGVIAVFIVGEVFSAPARRTIGLHPDNFILNAKSVALTDTLGNSIAGWYAEGKPKSGAVLLLHGVRSNRLQMIGRAKFLHTRGYSVMLIDLQAHGESGGDRITFGFREAKGVDTSLRFLRQQLPNEKIGVIGVSLGAASFMLADVQPAPSAVILESMYPTIEDAVTNRLRMRVGQWSSAIAPLLFSQIPLRIGIDVDQLRPIDRLANLHVPILIAGGTEDRHTPAAETKQIFTAANQPKDLWLVKGATHVDLYKFAPESYERTVGEFLAKHLRNEQQPSN